MMDRAWIAGISALLGFILAWMMGVQGCGKSQPGGQYIDTVRVVATDTLYEIDTASIIRPQLIYRTRIVRDTAESESLRAEIVRMREYAASVVFDDSAYIKHAWTVGADWLVRENRWEYVPAPRFEIHRIDTVIVNTRKWQRALTNLGFAVIGVGLGVVAKP